MKKVIIFIFFLLAFHYSIDNQSVYAEIIHSDLYGFSIEISDDWSKREPVKSYTLFAYVSRTSGVNLIMNVYSAKGLSSIKKAPLEQIFYPNYEYLNIIDKIYEFDSLSKIDIFKCIYTLKDGDYKKQLEGKYRMQYYLFQWIKDEKLFALTFADSEKNFLRNVRTFENMANSIKFDTSAK